MYPHPPEAGRTRSVPNIKSRTFKKFPGIGNTLKSPKQQNPAIGNTLKSPKQQNPAIGNTLKPPKQQNTAIGNTPKSPKTQTQRKKDLPRRADKKKEGVTLSPLVGVYKKNSRGMENYGDSRENYGDSRANYGDNRANYGDNRTSSGHPRNPDDVGTNPSILERSESFSKYKPLPAIDDKNEKNRNKISNKRTFETWSMESDASAETNTNPEKDDLLSDTIKKMKLGTDPERTYSQVTKHENENDTRKNPSERDKSEGGGVHGALHGEDGIPGTSSISLIIRLPDGERVHHAFSSSDTLGDIVKFLSTAMGKRIDLKSYVLYTNEVPKRELKNRRTTIVALGIQDKSVLALDTRDLPDRK